MNLKLTFFLLACFIAANGCAIAPTEHVPVVEPTPEAVLPMTFWVSVTVRQDGAAVYDDRVFKSDADLAALKIELEKLFEQRAANGEEQSGVTVKAWKDVKYGHAKRVCDAIKKIDGVRVGLQIEGMAPEAIDPK